jgi:hypothetical protein
MAAYSDPITVDSIKDAVTVRPVGFVFHPARGVIRRKDNTVYKNFENIER